MSRVLIMAGGTGGHVIPGLAVAEVLRSRGLEISWLGTAQGIEASLVPARGIPLEVINTRGLRGRGLGRMLTAPFMLFRSLFQAVGVLRRLRPAVVLGMGGYAAGPGGLAAWLMRCPLVLHEQNSVMGLTNRLLRPLARTTLFGFPGLAAGRRDRYVGNPLAGPSATEAIKNSGFAADGDDLPGASSNPLKILVLGGSQGARAINKVVAEFADSDYARQHCAIRHQCGKQLLEETVSFYEQSGTGAVYKLDGFIDDMTAAYRWADLVIARAGALTVSELCAAAKPSILIPLPSAAGDHQTTNAKLLVDQQAAILLPQDGLEASKLQATIEQLTNPEKRQQMATAAAQLAKPDAAVAVADICMEYCHA